MWVRTSQDLSQLECQSRDQEYLEFLLSRCVAVVSRGGGGGGLGCWSWEPLEAGVGGEAEDEL